MGCPGLLQGGAHLTGDPGILVIEVQQVQVTGNQNPQALGILRHPAALRHAVPEFEQDD
jgi:hypothetical protein